MKYYNETRKIFCIGFQKTGTTSLAAAFSRLGYRVTGPNGIYDERIGEHVDDIVRDLVPRYDVFQDNPWPIIFDRLDAAYPGSKFIFTFRDPDSWIRSVVNHFGGSDRPMLRWVYGVGDPVGNEQVFLDRYTGHREQVLSHFVRRPGDLLQLDVAAGDAWAQIGGFLGIDVPDEPFPHANSAGDLSRWDGTPWRRTYGRIRAALRRER